MLCARDNSDGILLATAYTAFAATPINNVTTKRSDTLMTHMDILLGTIGQEYASISLRTRRSKSLKSTSSYMRTLTIR